MTNLARSTVVSMPPIGRRELNKRAKLDRIIMAARILFLEKGFDDTTVKEIADRADVALGTIFLYAKDKVDLLLLIFDESLDLLTDRAFAQPLSGLSFIDQLMVVFEEFYKFFLETPRLSRDLFRVGTFFNPGIVGDRLYAGMIRTEEHVAALVAQNQAAGTVTTTLPAETMGKLIFTIYRAGIRLCLVDDTPDRESGLKLLRQNLTILFDGMKAR